MLGLSDSKIAGYVQDQQKAYQELEEAQRKMKKQSELQPEQIIPNFYQILDKVSNEFWKLDIDKQRWMLSKLIEGIEIRNISPHIYILTVKWLRAVAKSPDTALIYRGSNLRGTWTPEEEKWLRTNYPICDKLEILKHFPNRTWTIIKCRTSDLSIQRTIPQYRERAATGKFLYTLPDSPIHIDLAYNDWIKLSEYSKIDHESEEGHQILDRLNSYAAEIRGKEVAFNWLIPAEEASVSSILEASEANPQG
jgi:hypothetical protein